MALAFRSQSQGRKPQLHGTRLDIRKNTAAPTRDDVIAKPRLVGPSRVAASRHPFNSVMFDQSAHSECWTYKFGLALHRVAERLGSFPGCHLRWELPKNLGVSLTLGPPKEIPDIAAFIEYNT